MIPLSPADKEWIGKYTPDLMAALQKNTLLRLLSEKELTELLKECVVMEIEPGTELTRYGESVKHIYFIWQGQAKAVMGGRNGNGTSAVVNLLGPSSDVGLLSCIDEGPHSATVISMGDLRVIGVPVERMKKTLQVHPELYQVISQIALYRLRNLGVWISNLL